MLPGTVQPGTVVPGRSRPIPFSLAAEGLNLAHQSFPETAPRYDEAMQRCNAAARSFLEAGASFRNALDPNAESITLETGCTIGESNKHLDFRGPMGAVQPPSSPPAATPTPVS